MSSGTGQESVKGLTLLYHPTDNNYSSCEVHTICNCNPNFFKLPTRILTLGFRVENKIKQNTPLLYVYWVHINVVQASAQS